MEVSIETDRLLVTAQGRVEAYIGTELRSATSAQVNTDTSTPVDRGKFAYPPGSTRWQVIVDTARGPLVIDLPYVTGHANWTNTPEGAQACIDEITPLIGKFPSTVVVNTGAPLNSPIFTGIPEAPTADPDTNSTQIATTEYADAGIAAHIAATDPHGDRAYADSLAPGYDAAGTGASEAASAIADHVADTDPHGDRAYTDAQIAAIGGGAWGDITGTLSDQTDLQAELDLKANTSDLGTAAAADTGDFDAAGDAAAAVAAHVADTDPHGDRAYADGLAVNYDAAGDAAAAVAAHVSDTDPHGDRAYTDAEITALALGTASQNDTGDFDAAGTAAAAVASHVIDTDPHGDRAYADSLAGNYDAAGAAATAESNANIYTDNALADRVQAYVINIPVPANGTTFLYHFQAAATVISYEIRCTTGTFDPTVKINTTAVTNLTGHTTTSSLVSFTATAANTASAGDELNLTIASASAGAGTGVVIIYFKEG